MAEYNNSDQLNEIKKHNESYLKYLEIDSKKGILTVSNMLTSALPKKLRKRNSTISQAKPEREGSSLFITNIQSVSNKIGDIKEDSKLSNSLVAKNSEILGDDIMSKRYMTEIFKSEIDFIDILTLIEDDLLKQVRLADLLSDNWASLDHAINRLTTQLESEQNVVTLRFNELSTSKEELARQYVIKRAQINSSRSRTLNCSAELSEDQKHKIYAKIFAVAVDMGIADRKDRKTSDLNFEIAMDYLKEITFLAEKFVETHDTFKSTNKRRYDKEKGEYHSEKRDKIRYEAEVAKEVKRVEETRIKKEREQRNDREMGGRRRYFEKHFVEEISTEKVEKEKKEEFEAKDKIYFRPEN